MPRKSDLYTDKDSQRSVWFKVTKDYKVEKHVIKKRTCHKLDCWLVDALVYVRDVEVAPRMLVP